MSDRLVDRLRASAEVLPSQALDHQVRTALRTLPFAGSGVARFPLLAVSLAGSALVALVVALSGLAAESGLGDDAIPSVIRWVAGYLLLSGVAVIPLLLRLRRPEAIES